MAVGQYFGIHCWEEAVHDPLSLSPLSVVMAAGLNFVHAGYQILLILSGHRGCEDGASGVSSRLVGTLWMD